MASRQKPIVVLHSVLGLMEVIEGQGANKDMADRFRPQRSHTIERGERLWILLSNHVDAG